MIYFRNLSLSIWTLCKSSERRWTIKWPDPLMKLTSFSLGQTALWKDEELLRSSIKEPPFLRITGKHSISTGAKCWRCTLEKAWPKAYATPSRLAGHTYNFIASGVTWLIMIVSCYRANTIIDGTVLEDCIPGSPRPLYLSFPEY